MNIELSIHRVVKVKSRINDYETSDTKKPFFVRQIIVKDDKGNETKISLFADIKKDLDVFEVE